MDEEEADEETRGMGAGHRCAPAATGPTTGAARQPRQLAVLPQQPQISETEDEEDEERGEEAAGMTTGAPQHDVGQPIVGEAGGGGDDGSHHHRNVNAGDVPESRPKVGPVRALKAMGKEMVLEDLTPSDRGASPP